MDELTTAPSQELELAYFQFEQFTTVFHGWGDADHMLR